VSGVEGAFLGQLQYGQPPLWNGGQISVGIGTEPEGDRYNGPGMTGAAKNVTRNATCYRATVMWSALESSLSSTIPDTIRILLLNYTLTKITPIRGRQEYTPSQIPVRFFFIFLQIDMIKIVISV
jgi:hypothetical protein